MSKRFRHDKILHELHLPRGADTYRLAKLAHRDHFPARRGWFDPDDNGLITLFDNSPIPSRDAQTLELIARLVIVGHKLVAADSYPRTGPDAGYTLCLAIQPRPGLTPEAAVNEILDARCAIARGTEPAPAATG